MQVIGVLSESYFRGTVGQKSDCRETRSGNQCVEVTLIRFLVIKEKCKAGEGGLDFK